MASSFTNRMPSEDFQVMQSCYDYLVVNIGNPETLVDYLFSKMVLTLDTKTAVFNEPLYTPRVRKLLDIIMNESGDCYMIFIDALREKGFTVIADELEIIKSQQRIKRGSEVMSTKDNPEEELTKHDTTSQNTTPSENKIDISMNETPLDHSAYGDNIDGVKVILSQSCDNIYLTDLDGDTPIEKACISESNGIDKFKSIVSKGYSKLNALVKICQSAPNDLIRLIFDKMVYDKMDESDQNGIIEIRQLLLQGCSLDSATKNNKTLLHYACEYSTLATVRYLIDNGCNLNIEDSWNRTPLFSCCYTTANSVEKIALLVSSGARLDVTDKDSARLLHYSCAFSSYEAVKFLIDNGCNVNNVGGKYNRTPLFYCCVRDSPQAVAKIQLLMDSGAKLDVRDLSNQTVLHKACQCSTVQVVKYLIDKKHTVNCVDRYNRTPLFFCCDVDVLQAMDKIQLLVASGAGLDVKDTDNFTLLHISCQCSSLDVVKYFIDKNCSVNCEAINKTTIFFSCCISDTQRVDKMKLLLSKNCNFESRDKEECIIEAEKRGYHETVDFLKSVPIKKWYQIM
ncbi:hypothetical protein SNE40_012227 [Patella caerulea]|uniref:CARD domain-containing protein n=2 Tax=Patella caerulea TaxID=87958 RepID=A0AAN8Q0D2_PATCE